jgi:hypothetical protein
MLETILVEGPLWKLKTSFTGAKTWKECYVSVVMKESTLHVQRSSNSNVSNSITVFLYQWSENYKPSLTSRRMPKHVVDLSKCITTYYPLRQHGFVITSQLTKDILIFACNEEANFDEWLTVMNNCTLKATDVAYKTRTNQAVKSVGEEASSDDDSSSIDQNLSIMSNLMRRNKDRERAVKLTASADENQSTQSEGQDSIEAKDDASYDDQSSTSESVVIQRIPRSKTIDRKDDGLNDVIAHPDAQTVYRYFFKNNVMPKVQYVIQLHYMAWLYY